MIPTEKSETGTLDQDHYQTKPYLASVGFRLNPKDIPSLGWLNPKKTAWNKNLSLTAGAAIYMASFGVIAIKNSKQETQYKSSLTDFGIQPHAQVEYALNENFSVYYQATIAFNPSILKPLCFVFGLRTNTSLLD